MAFGLVKHNNNSISAITSAGQLAQGKMTLLQTQTASSSASISFTSNIDSTYPIYLFKIINIHPASDNVNFQVNFRDGGSSYDATKTTTSFAAYHQEDGGDQSLFYSTSRDLAQSTGVQRLVDNIGNANDECTSGYLFLFNPSSTTFVKHFISEFSQTTHHAQCWRHNVNGYCNVTAAIDGVQYSMSSGNIDSGTIKLYGIKDS
jgi:hypothetical protein